MTNILECRTTKTSVVVGGSVDSGKSTFGAVLHSGIYDDGAGSARLLIAKHPHEITSGKTSDISTRTYEIKGKNEDITIVDTCGHGKYLGTTTYGICAYLPDYAVIIISANRGVLPMTKQHMRLILSLGIPTFFVITHIDISPVEVYETTKTGIVKSCMMYGGRSSFVKFVNDIADQSKTADEQIVMENEAANTILESITNLSDGKQNTYCVLSISNKTGFFFNTVRKIFDNLKPRDLWPKEVSDVSNDKIVKLFRAALEKQKSGSSSIIPEYKPLNGSIFMLESAYTPPGIGLVVCGINRGNPIKLNDTLYFGPFNKTFYEVRVRSMHNNIRQITYSLNDHDRGCIAIGHSKKDDITKDNIKKGTILLSSATLIKNVCYRFKAVMTMFTNSLTLKSGYCPIVHLNTIRQPARMIIDPEENNGNDVLCFDGKTTTIAIVTFKFKQHPEFIELFSKFVLRSGDLQGVGIVIGITPIEDDQDAIPDPVKNRKHHVRKHKVKIITKQPPASN